LSRQGRDKRLEQDRKIFYDEIRCSNNPEQIPETHVPHFRKAKVEAASKQLNTSGKTQHKKLSKKLTNYTSLYEHCKCG